MYIYICMCYVCDNVISLLDVPIVCYSDNGLQLSVASCLRLKKT